MYVRSMYCITLQLGRLLDVWHPLFLPYLPYALASSAVDGGAFGLTFPSPFDALKPMIPYHSKKPRMTTLLLSRGLLLLPVTTL